MAVPVIGAIGSTLARSGAKKGATKAAGASAKTAAKEAMEQLSDQLEDADCERDGTTVVCDVDLGSGVTAEATFDIKR